MRISDWSSDVCSSDLDTVTGTTINAAPGDPLLNFEITQPINSDQTAAIDGWEFALQHSFWDTGFGVILNYTIVNGDADRKSVVEGKSVSVRVHLGGRRIITKKKTNYYQKRYNL